MNTVLCEVNGHVAVVTINRPAALNALSTEVLEDLQAVLKEVDANKDVYAMIITGAGPKSFVAGADIAEMKDKTVEEAAAYSKLGNEVFRSIETFRCPVIAAVNGFALGGGNELAMSCDLRIASSKARFGQPEAGLGITPGYGGTQRLARLVGPTLAKELIYTCAPIKADRAYEIGLVNKVVEPETLMDEALALANTIAAQAPIAVALCKKCVNEGLQTDIDSGIAIEVDYFSKCFDTEDQKMAMTAFVNKEKHGEFQNK